MAEMQELLTVEKGVWATPPSRNVGRFTDMTLYAEALALASEQSVVNVLSLQNEIKERLRKMLLVPRQSEGTVADLVRELHAFGWLQLLRQKEKVNPTLAPYEITPEGRAALSLSKQRGTSAFLRLLTVKMQETYTIPGWFIARLWQINPMGQGEVIIPVPVPDWRPASSKWNDSDWDVVLEDQTLKSAKYARQANSCAFPVHDDDWLDAVRHAWNRMSDLKPRRGYEPKSVFYTPRRRLSLAMREACVKLLFSEKPYGQSQPDFDGNLPPIYPRTYQVWVPRLEALELIFYTDWHPRVSGRLLYPTSVFRQEARSNRFEKLDEIQDPNGVSLWLHQPEWASVRSSFLETLLSVHQQVSTRVGAMYVSLLDVRDEVCRQLRISALCFDRFLEKVLQELPAEDFRWSIAVETDIREKESSGIGQLRRPVYLAGVPHTLIALARLPQK